VHFFVVYLAFWELAAIPRRYNNVWQKCKINVLPGSDVSINENEILGRNCNNTETGNKN